MCFSANASFAASTVTGVVGIIAITKTKTTSQLLFAIIPLLFSVQQLSEGILWLSLKQESLAPWRSIFLYVFLVFATIIWPVIIPLTTRLLEKDRLRKRILSVLCVLGATASATILWIMICFPLQVTSAGHHLHYQFDLPKSVKGLVWIFTSVYLVATIAAPFVSSIKGMNWLGLVFLGAYALTLATFPSSVVSVWCYFAATLSIIVLWILMEIRKYKKNIGEIVFQ